MEIIIRPATIADMPRLLEFEQGVIKAERPFDITLKPDPLTYYNLPALIESDDAMLLVAEINEQVIGCGYAMKKMGYQFLKHTHHAYLGFMYVEPAFRGKGINQKIVGEVKTWARMKGLTELRLEVYVPNTGAIRAYEKAGFTQHMIEMRSALD